MSPSPQADRQVDADMEAIRARILELGGFAEMQFGQALHALFEQDSMLARQVIDQDHRVSRLQQEIDRMCFATISRRQSAPPHLRLIVSQARSVQCLRRIGGEAKQIAHVVERLATPNRLPSPGASQVRPGAQLAQDMVRAALDSLARLDAAGARRVIESNDAAERESLSMLQQLVRFMTGAPHAISASLEVLAVARSIENIRNHAKAISELVIDTVDQQGTAAHPVATSGGYPYL